MNDPTSFDLPLGQIAIPDDRARTFDPVWAEALADIIRAQGLINPVLVRRNQTDDGWVLVAGRHRLAAFGIMGADDIPCRVSSATTASEARLEEVMENLIRNELTALDRCQHLYEMKLAYEEVYPEAKHGAASTKSRKPALSENAEENPVFGFAKATSEAIGLGVTQIKSGVKIWTDLSEDSRTRLRGTRFAEKQSDVRLLSAQIPRVQGKVLDILLAEEPEYHTVADALALVTKGFVAEDTARRFKALNVTLRRLPDPDFDRLLLENESRVIASLKRQGVL